MQFIKIKIKILGQCGRVLKMRNFNTALSQIQLALRFAISCNDYEYKRVCYHYRRFYDPSHLM